MNNRGLRNFVTAWNILLMLSIVVVSCDHKSGRKDKQNLTEKKEGRNRTIDRDDNYVGKTTLEIESDNGVKYVWIEINELKLKFIFDTGASSICLSSAEATVLYKQGTLRKEDFLDIEYFQDATGKVSAGTRINIRTVKIGNRILRNIEGIVIDNKAAPLLLGPKCIGKIRKILY